MKACIENAFEKIGVVPLYKRLANFNVDGASVNTGLHNGLGVKLRESAPWPGPAQPGGPGGPCAPHFFAKKQKKLKRKF